MIKTLSIQNYAIIKNLEIDFSTGLTIITGETGAGKSILLGGLGLIMGERADLKIFYNQEEKCVIEGVFNIGKYNLKDFFDNQELDYDEEITVRREITPSGKSRAFIQDTPVTLEVLKRLSESLIDLHQQFDNLDIHEVSFQLRMVDALAGNEQLLRKYSAIYKQLRANHKKLQELIRQAESGEKEKDFLNFQLEELEEASLEGEEQERLEAELKKLSNAEDIKKVLSELYGAFMDSEMSVMGQLQDITRSLASLAPFSTEIEKNKDNFESLRLEMQEIAENLGKIAEETEHDPERIAEIQARLDLIYKLQKKHQVISVGELLEIQSSINQKLNLFQDLSQEISTLERAIDEQEDHLESIAIELNESRKAVVPAFEKKIMDMLAQLAMPSARLEIEIHELEDFSPTGKDDVRFLFSANKGSRLQPIKDVASGGELSRLTLVVKSLVASAIPLPTLIFDEIDSGVSGDVAQKMGDILQSLSNQHQVIVITHSPQVASKAHAHYFIYKKETPERTLTEVKKLTPDERIRELAIMLSQNPPTEAAIENAKELLSFQNIHQ